MITSDTIFATIEDANVDKLKQLNQEIKESKPTLTDTEYSFLIKNCREKIVSKFYSIDVKEQLAHLSIHLIHQYQTSAGLNGHIARNVVLENRLAYLHATDFHDAKLTESLTCILTDEKMITRKVNHLCFFHKKVYKNEDRVNALEGLIGLSAQKDRATLRLN